MKNKLIKKHQIGSTIKKIGNFLLDGFVRFGNAQIAGDSGVGTSMAVASGYKHNPQTGMWEQSEENIKEAEGLRNNLAVLSAFSPAIFSGVKFGLGNAGNFFKSPIGRKWLKESLKGMAWGTGSDIVSQGITGKSLTNHIYDAADKGLQQVLPEETYNYLSENVPDEVKHIGAGLLNPMYYGPKALSSMVNGIYGGVSNGFNQIENALVKNVPWIRNQFVANQIHNNIANTNLQIPNNINFGAKYITTTPYKYNIHGDNKSNIEWLQLTGQLQPKSQSNLTQLEQLGVPKDIRNMKRGYKRNNLINYYKRLDTDPWLIKNFKKWFYNNNVPSNAGQSAISSRINLLGNDLPDEMLQFIKSLPEPDVKYSDNYIALYRNYLTNADYNHEILSDLDIQKILNASNTQLVKSQSGLMKGKHVFHSTNQNLFDHFDWRKKTGTNTLNMGGQGPGNYFSAHGSGYGIHNVQPYLINDIDKILPGSVKQLHFRFTPTPSGLENPEYLKTITSDNPIYNILQRRKNEIQTAINTTKESNTIYYGKDIPNKFFEAPALEFALPRNTGIKSLFPHPKTFIKNSDGSISLIRDWNDFRLNYKIGGKFKNIQ